RWPDEVAVRNTEGCAGGLVHERPEPDPECAEVEDGVDDARDRRGAPHAPVLHQPVLEDAEWQRETAQSSTRVRPVRWRKTSSSVERRTRNHPGPGVTSAT